MRNAKIIAIERDVQKIYIFYSNFFFNISERIYFLKEKYSVKCSNICSMSDMFDNSLDFSKILKLHTDA